MAANILLSELVILVLGISFVITVEAGMIIMTNFTCNVDPGVCKNNICKLEHIRKGIKFLDFACYFEEKQDNVTFHVTMHKLGNGGRKIIDSLEDFCKVTAKEGPGTVITRLLPSVNKHGTLFSPCPLSGNMTLIRYPVDFSFVPMILTPGNYRLSGTFRTKQQTSKLPIMHADLYFTVRNVFKKY